MPRFPRRHPVGHAPCVLQVTTRKARRCTSDRTDATKSAPRHPKITLNHICKPNSPSHLLLPIRHHLTSTAQGGICRGVPYGARVPPDRPNGAQSTARPVLHLLRATGQVGHWAARTHAHRRASGAAPGKRCCASSHGSRLVRHRGVLRIRRDAVEGHVTGRAACQGRLRRGSCPHRLAWHAVGRERLGREREMAIASSLRYIHVI